MKIENEFRVSAPVDQAWDLLTDIPTIAPCMPGAQLTGADGDEYQGKVKIKVGPITSEYKGSATFIERDGDAHKAVIKAEGRDSRGAGNANANITALMRADGDGTIVSIDTDLKITGKVAQFGRGVIVDVSEKLLGQFVDCLEQKLMSVEQDAGKIAGATADVAAEGSAGIGGVGAGAAGVAGVAGAAAAGAGIAGAAGKLGDIAGDAVGGATGAASDAAGATGVGDAVAGATGKVEDVAGGVTGKVGDVAGGVTGKVGDVAGGVTGKVGDVAGGVTGKVGDVAGGVTGKVGDVAGGVTGKVGDVAGGAAGKLGDAAGGVGGMGKAGLAAGAAAAAGGAAAAKGAFSSGDDEVEALDLGELAGGAVFKRFIPVAIAIIALIILLIIIF